MKHKPITLIILFVLVGLFFINNLFALETTLSNESILAKESIIRAEKDISEMISRNIPINRVNETYLEAIQLYSAQVAFEEKGAKANYKLVIEDALKIAAIKEKALQAKDELEVFKETFESAKKESNLSEFQTEYNDIINSFNDERFEDTLGLIKKGYLRISEIQAKETTANAFYLETTKSIKDFFKKYGLKILMVLAIAIILLIIFWNNLKKLKIKMQLNNFIVQKKSINGLIKKMQADYFKTKKMSETEYNVKLKKYEELLRDIERQVMILRENLFKVEKKY